MRNIIYFFIMILLFLTVDFIFINNCYADSLNTINVQINKTTINPEEEVNIIINFGQELSSYSFNFQYDNNLFDFISVDNGIATNTLNSVLVTYNDRINFKNSLSIVFKAKDDITTSNPTEFLVTAENLFNSNMSINFDDITVPIVKNVIVEPKYKDYILKLSPTEHIIKGEENDILISFSSEMGRNYAHARLLAEAETPDGAFVKLLGENQNGIKQDIIQSGWEDSQGYPIGGKNIVSELHFKGIFSDIGNYKITLKLIDRDDSDNIIAEKQFPISVIEFANTDNNSKILENQDVTTLEESGVLINENVGENISNSVKNDISNIDSTENNKVINKTQNATPTKLPKTGINFYVHIMVLTISLISVLAYVFRKK